MFYKRRIIQLPRLLLSLNHHQQNLLSLSRSHISIPHHFSTFSINKNQQNHDNSSSKCNTTIQADDPAAIPNNQEEYQPKIKVPPPVRPPNEPLETKRARLVYMSRKRGILETDLLLSTFAEKNLKKMDLKQLKEYDQFLEENDWDIYYWATEAKVAPDHVQSLSFFNDLVEHSKNKERNILRMPDL